MKYYVFIRLFEYGMWLDYPTEKYHPHIKYIGFRKVYYRSYRFIKVYFDYDKNGKKINQ